MIKFEQNNEHEGLEKLVSTGNQNTNYSMNKERITIER